MKKTMLCLGLMFLGAFTYAQNGLDSVILETYYISNAADAAASIGTLPVGSTTYRLYVAMKPGYKFQALYGVQAPLHELKLTTTTTFFNNEHRGATTPSYTKTQAKGNSVMLDSWFSVGAACAGQIGVLKSTDDGVATVVNSDGILQNNDPQAGISVMTQDGMIAGSPQAVSFVGLTTELNVFDATSQQGNSFSTTNGSIASLNGSTGPDAANRVLIVQFTTDGNFCYELNIQIMHDSSGYQVTESYVAKNPTGHEISLPSLMGCVTTFPTGIKNLNSSNQLLNIYPNPTVDAIAFEVASSTQNSSYTIYSIEWKEILHKELPAVTQKHTEKLDMSSFVNGMYILEVSQDGVIAHKQFIKN